MPATPKVAPKQPRQIDLAAPFSADESFARRLDDADPLRAFRAEFLIPPSNSSAQTLYLCGNSLGLQPRATQAAIVSELEDWAAMGVEAHHAGRHPWLNYHEALRDPAARLIGALPDEVVMMNSLTVNLHLLMATFYRPTATRFKVVIEDDAFPSDSYAVASQARWHGLDPATAILRLKPRAGEDTLRTEDILDLIEAQGDSIALVMLGGVNYLTGQWFDMPTITAAAKKRGCVVGWDLAHAAGNVPLKLHDWNVDFAAWCTYKYLNSGPGAVAGAFIHERHTKQTKLNRLAGWWGNDPATRFEMGTEFHARASADGWQLSNPPIFSLAPVRVSLEIFDRATMPALREKSLKLTGYLEFLLNRLTNGGGKHVMDLITPREASARGCQLSLAVTTRAKELHAQLGAQGVICDFREPNVIRVAPAPLYNTFHDVWRFAQICEQIIRAH